MKKTDKKELNQKDTMNTALIKPLKTYSVHSNKQDKHHTKYNYDFQYSCEESGIEIKPEIHQSNEMYSNKIFQDFNNFENSSIFPDLQKIKKELEEESRRQRNLILQLTKKNQQLINQKQQLKKVNEQAIQLLNKKQYELYELKHHYQELSNQTSSSKEQIIKLRKQNAQYLEINMNLKKKNSYFQTTLKSIKQNRQIAKDKQNLHQPKINVNQIYDSVSLYLKERCQQLIHSLKTLKMSAKLQIVIQNFIQQILLINQITINNFQKNKNLEQILYVNDFDNDRFQISNKKVNKSINKLIEKVKYIDKQENHEINKQLELKSLYTTKNLNMLSPYTNYRETTQLKNRSKSRKRIFQ